MSKKIWAVLYARMRRRLFPFIRKVFETLCPGEEFLENWHIEAVAWHLERCLAGDINRLIITMPPRNLKSMCASVAFPVWLLGRDPTCHVICVSYSEDLANAFSLARRKFIQTSLYSKVFPQTHIDKAKNTESEFHTTKGGSCLATSVGGTLTGRGANFFIIDDPIKAEDGASEAARNRTNNWFANTAYSRLNNKDEDVIIIVMQRVHQDDLAGFVQDLDDWTVLDLPAIAPDDDEKVPISDDYVFCRKRGEALHPERESLETLDRIKSVIGSYNFSAQYQQAPVPPGGNMVRAHWFKRYCPTEFGRDFPQIVQSWDTAMVTGQGASYSVCTTWGIIENNYYLLDVLRERLEFPELQRTVIVHARRHQASTVLTAR